LDYSKNRIKIQSNLFVLFGGKKNQKPQTRKKSKNFNVFEALKPEFPSDFLARISCHDARSAHQVSLTPTEASVRALQAH